MGCVPWPGGGLRFRFRAGVWWPFCADDTAGAGKLVGSGGGSTGAEYEERGKAKMIPEGSEMKE